MKHSFFVGLVFGLTLLGSPVQVSQAGLCDDPLRDQETCYRMKHLRSSVNLLEAQRDLLQLNYPYLGAIAEDMSGVIGEILKDPTNGHYSALRGVFNVSKQLSLEAKAQNPQVLVTANTVRKQCSVCHAPTSPPSGITWGEISKNAWDHILVKCNEAGKNPYHCKNMFGLVGVYSSFMTAGDAGVGNFNAAIANSDEIIRIASDLKAKGLNHGPDALLEQLMKDAQEVKSLAINKDVSTFEKAKYIGKSCFACHGNGM